MQKILITILAAATLSACGDGLDAGKTNGGTNSNTSGEAITAIEGTLTNFAELPEDNYIVWFCGEIANRTPDDPECITLAQGTVDANGNFKVSLPETVTDSKLLYSLDDMPATVTVSNPGVSIVDGYLALEAENDGGTLRSIYCDSEYVAGETSYVEAWFAWFSDDCDVVGTRVANQGTQYEETIIFDMHAKKGWNKAYRISRENEDAETYYTTSLPAGYKMEFYVEEDTFDSGRGAARR